MPTIRESCELSSASAGNSTAELSLIMPCFNEEKVVEHTIDRLLAAFKDAGYRLEIVAVNNGSRDHTGAILEKLSENSPSIVVQRVEKNEGYGNGVLRGLPLCSSPWVGIIPADNQVDADDVVRLYESTVLTHNNTLGKVRRRFRMDGMIRKVVSVAYNLFFRLLWPTLGSIDINGSPKILRLESIRAMKLTSKNWLLDPEIMVKARAMGMQIIEMNVFARMRCNGLSHVRVGTCWEFFWELLMLRFSRRIPRWKQTLGQTTPSSMDGSILRSRTRGTSCQTDRCICGSRNVETSSNDTADRRHSNAPMIP